MVAQSLHPGGEYVMHVLITACEKASVDARLPLPRRLRVCEDRDETLDND